MGDWADLFYDLVRLIVRQEPAILPALYRVNKHFQAALEEDDPNAPYWEKWFHSKPGYSQYTPTSSATLRITHRPCTWKQLTRIRPRLEFQYFVKVESPCWSCGIKTGARHRPSVCSISHYHTEAITSWETCLVPITNMKFPLHGHPLWFSCVDGDYPFFPMRDYPFFPMRMSVVPFVWDALLQQILYHGQDYKPVVAAALAKDIPKGEEWRIARFVGIV